MHRVTAALLATGFLAGTLAVSAGAAGASVTPQEKAQAQQALLVLSDFPKGWTSSLNQGSSGNSDIAGNVQMARCLGVSPSSLEFNPPQVQSPAFTDLAGKVIVENSILVFRSASLAHDEYAALDNPKAAGCISAQQAGQGSTGTTFGPPPHVSMKKLPASKGTVSFEVSSSFALPGSPNGTMSLVLVFSFFTHEQFGDVVTAFSYRSGANVHSLAQRLLHVARSRL